MKKRLFVAVPLSDEFRAVFAKYAKRRQAEKFLGSPGIRWTPPANIHLTLCFLGYYDEKLVSGIVKQLEEIAQGYTPFSLEFSGIAWGPRGRPARMVWGVFTHNETYASLAKQISKTLSKYLTRELGRKVNLVEERPIIPHVTLARFKPIALREAGELPKLPQSPTRFEVSSFALYESYLRSTGVIYTELVTFPLQLL